MEIWGKMRKEELLPNAHPGLWGWLPHDIMAVHCRRLNWWIIECANQWQHKRGYGVSCNFHGLGGGVGNFLLIFEFFIKYSIGLRWILQIHLFKFWKLEILCIKIWKLQIRRGAALHPTWNNCIFNFRLKEYFLLRLIKNIVLFLIECLHCKTAWNVNCPGLSGVKRRFRHRLQF